MGLSRNENILENMLGANNPVSSPMSREEKLLIDLKNKLPSIPESEGNYILKMVSDEAEYVPIKDNVFVVEIKEDSQGEPELKCTFAEIAEAWLNGMRIMLETYMNDSTVDIELTYAINGYAFIFEGTDTSYLYYSVIIDSENNFYINSCSSGKPYFVYITHDDVNDKYVSDTSKGDLFNYYNAGVSLRANIPDVGIWYADCVGVSGDNDISFAFDDINNAIRYVATVTNDIYANEYVKIDKFAYNTPFDIQTTSTAISDDTVLTNRTFAEINTAYNNGSRLRLIMDVQGINGIADLQTRVNNDTFIFSVDAPNMDYIFTAFVFGTTGQTYAVAKLYSTPTNSGGGGSTVFSFVAQRDDDADCWIANTTWDNIKSAYDSGKHIRMGIGLYDNSNIPEVIAELVEYDQLSDSFTFVFSPNGFSKLFYMHLQRGNPLSQNVYGHVYEISATNIDIGGITS